MEIITFSKGIYGVYKPVGLTPSQTISELKKAKPELLNTPLTYAGRLDPMAEGLLLLLDSSIIKNKDEFLQLDKVYEAEVLLGVSTDSFDLLGIPSLSSLRANRLSIKRSNLNHEAGIAASSRLIDATPGLSSSLSPESSSLRVEDLAMTETLKSFVGQTTLPLPPYSSPPLNGKPLFVHAQAGTITAENSPTRTTTIHSLGLDGMQTVSSEELLTYIKTHVPEVQGDFRTEDIIGAWQNVLDNKTEFTSIKLTAHVSHGTYIRSLAYILGKTLGAGACVYKLKRTKVGPFILPN